MTQYERGVDQVERKIQHYYEFHGYYVMRSAGSHGPADLIVIGKNFITMIQCKLHDKLRDEQREQELKAMDKPSNVMLQTAWKSKFKNRIEFSMQSLESGLTLKIPPLKKEQEKEYQARKKAYFAAKKKPKKAMVPNTRKR